MKLYAKQMPFTGTTLLSKLQSAVLDVEATGLEVLKDKIVHLVAVHLENAQITSEVFDQLINPQQPISLSSFKIHGIDNRTVEKEKSYYHYNKLFHEFLADRVLIGYNIGFDLALIRTEAKRAGLKPREYRFLDVRLLALSLNLPHANTLEAIAKSFKLDTKERHSALGDALITAKLYLKLIPLLEAVGTKTLAQAEAVCHSELKKNSDLYAPEWYCGQLFSSKNEKHPHEFEWEELSRIDPFPFTHRVKEIMQPRLVIGKAHQNLVEVSRQLRDADVSALLIEPADQQGKGIITERDLVKAIAKQKVPLNEISAGTIMKRPVLSLHENDFVYKAMELMETRKVRHLMILNNQEKAVGIVSSREVMASRSALFYLVKERILTAKTVADLKALHSEIPRLAKRLSNENLKVLEVARIISAENNAIVRKSLELALEKMQTEGRGAPPAEFALLVLGSAGREESLLIPDQDNALVFSNRLRKPGGSEAEAKQWFMRLGAHLNELLDKAGIPYCPGGVMAREAAWCDSLSGWFKRLRGWMKISDGRAILKADIFFDGKFIYGNRELALELQRFAFQLVSSEIAFLKLMGDNIIQNSPYPFRLLLSNTLKTKNGYLDFKAVFLFPIVAAARVFAMKAGYREELGTVDRLTHCAKEFGLKSYDLELLAELHQMAMQLSLEEQLRLLVEGKSKKYEVYLPVVSAKRVRELSSKATILKGIATIIEDVLSR